MRVLQTTYDGYHFRSRLKVCWAVFWNALALPYETKRDSFDLDGLWYLPSFRLLAQDCWVQITRPLLPVDEFAPTTSSFPHLTAASSTGFEYGKLNCTNGNQADKED